MQRNYLCVFSLTDQNNKQTHKMDNTSNSSLLGMSPKKSKRTIPASVMAQNTMNPIRRIVDRMKLEPNPDHDFISLSIGKLCKFFNEY